MTILILSPLIIILPNMMTNDAAKMSSAISKTNDAEFNLFYIPMYVTSFANIPVFIRLQHMALFTDR